MVSATTCATSEYKNSMKAYPLGFPVCKMNETHCHAKFFNLNLV